MIIFLYGEDVLRSRRKMFEIKNKFLSSDKSGSGLSVFDFEESASSANKEMAKNIINTISTPNLLAPKRLVIVKNLISKSSVDMQKEILEFLKDKKDFGENKDVVAVFWEGEALKKSNALYKFLESKEAGVRSQNFEKLSGIKLETWALRIIKEINPKAEISKIALSKLTAYCASDNFLLFQEIQKLIDYADQEMISEKDVDMLVRANLSNNIFQMVDALGANNKKEALRLLHEHLEKGDDPFYLFSMFFYQFRNMLKVADLFARGIRSEYEIARIAKLHPFVVKKSLGQISRLSFSRLKNIYQELGKLDASIKTGRIEIKLALDKFIAEM